jgi:hypothetical protein
MTTRCSIPVLVPSFALLIVALWSMPSRADEVAVPSGDPPVASWPTPVAAPVQTAALAPETTVGTYALGPMAVAPMTLTPASARAPVPAPVPASMPAPLPMPAAAVGPTPVMTVASAPPVSAAGDRPRRELGWVGFGLRFGFTSFALDGSAFRETARDVADGTVDSLTGMRGTTVAGDLAAARIGDFRASMKTLTPALHLGGDGYFFKLEAPLGLSSDFRSVGLGIYPLNYGVFFPAVGLFPYATLGGAAHYLSGQAAGYQPTRGAVLQGRAALGLKWRVVSRVNLCLEAGYSAAAGVLGSTEAKPVTAADQSSVKAGLGRSLDMSFGIEIL